MPWKHLHLSAPYPCSDDGQCRGLSVSEFLPGFQGMFLTGREAVMVVGMLSALLAAIMALVSNDLKRVLAYSTVSQLGYMVYAVGAGSVFASQFHLFSHSIFKALLFLAAGAVIHSIGTRDMTAMGGVGKNLPFVQASSSLVPWHWPASPFSMVSGARN